MSLSGRSLKARSCSKQQAMAKGVREKRDRREQMNCSSSSSRRGSFQGSVQEVHSKSCSTTKMWLPKIHVFFFLCCCLTLVRTFDWQNLSPIGHIKSSAWIDKIYTLVAAANSSQTRIPRGKGPYTVGCTDLMFDYTNESTFLRLYYPSKDDKQNEAVWIPNKEYFFGLSKVLRTNWLMGKLMNLLFGSMTVPANWNSPMRTGEKYPLIIFSHGLGGLRTIYSAVGIDLSSHGFIVASVEHRDESASATYYFQDQFAAKTENKTWLYFKILKQADESFERNKQVRQRAKECSQALNFILDIDSGRQVNNVLDLPFDIKQLKDSVDRNKIAVMGHSFGGATVLQTLSEDQRFRCGIALDAWMFPLGDEVYSRIPQPLFYINSEKFQYPENIEKMQQTYLQGKERKMITIRGSVHQNFDDFTFATNKVTAYIFSLQGHIDSKVAIDLTNKASLAFLQKHLGLQKNFDQWDNLIEGDDDNLIPGPILKQSTTK